MQVMTGTKRETIIRLWNEQLEKNMKRANESMECFRRFEEADDLAHLIEDCEKIIENAKQAKKCIEFMNANRIK